MNTRRARRRLLQAAVAIVMTVLCAAAPSQLSAAGEEYSRKVADLSLHVDSRWAGGMHGGYYPVRIRVRNTGKERELLFRFSADNDSNLPDVLRRITIGQNATRQFTLSIPMVSGDTYGSYGELRVSQGGRTIKEFSNTISLPESGSNVINCPSLLVVSPTRIDCEPFFAAANSLSSQPTSPYGYGYGVNMSSDFQVIEPTMLPDSAIDYSALDILALSQETLTKLPDDTRTAMLGWVRMGGKLIVYETGAKTGELPKLPGLSEPGDWKPADVAARQPIKIINEEEINSGGHVLTVEEENQSDEEKAQELAKLKGEFLWKGEPKTFSMRELMLGHVIVFPGNPFPGSAHDWAWLFNSLKPDTWRWTTRFGISSRQPDESFMRFVIPGVGGVPKIAFILLITGFTIVIGPLNYFLLKRRRQLFLLVVTIPAIAFLTSCSLFAYAAISDGFGVKSRARSFTLLDQKNNTAISLGRIALYAGITPADGLKFSNDTALFPVWAYDRELPGGRLDLTGGQHFVSGWVRSRTPTQFVTISQRTERGRLEVSPDGDNTLNVANGFAWEIETVVVADEKGNLYQGTSLPAGASVRLKQSATTDVIAHLREIHKEHPFNLNPATVHGTPSPSPFSMMSGMELAAEVNYDTSTLEREIHRLLLPKKSAKSILPPRTFLAVLKGNPGIELGVENTEPHGDFHLLLGKY